MRWLLFAGMDNNGGGNVDAGGRPLDQTSPRSPWLLRLGRRSRLIQILVRTKGRLLTNPIAGLQSEVVGCDVVVVDGGGNDGDASLPPVILAGYTLFTN